MNAPGHIADIEIVEAVGRGAESVVYRGRCADREVAVKVFRDLAGTGGPSRMWHEAAALVRLDHPGLPRVESAGIDSGAFYLVMDYVRGPTLAARLSAGPLAERDVLVLAKRVAGALAEVHRHGLVHGDVKPSNLILPTLEDAVLVDFGMASHAEDAAGDGHTAVGTLRYSAPEKTGMLHRPVDGRSDLYALGGLLFEALTGRTVFVTDDPAEMARCHATARPQDVRDLVPTVSPALARIIARLLAKDPDDRYPSGRALQRDLARIRDINVALARGADIVLASSSRLTTNTESMLVGRRAELGMLVARWHKARTGRGRVVLLRGESGVGKSRLTRELVREVTEGSAALLLAKCMSSDPVPFAPLRAAIDGLARRAADAEDRALADVLAKAIGRHGALLAAFSPQLAAMDLEAERLDVRGAAQDQFLEAIAAFITRLATLRPTLFVVDDAQWLDPASRGVLESLLGRLGSLPLMVVLVVRRDGVDSAERQWQQVDDIIELDRLSQAGSEALVRALLGGRDVPETLVQRLVSRGGGNPFVLQEVVRATLEGGQLRLEWGRWVLTGDLANLDLPDDLLHLIDRRVSALAEETQQILTVGALVGTHFSAALVASALGLAIEEVIGGLELAERARLVERLAADDFAFVHDRIREALAAAVDPEVLPGLHLALAAATRTHQPEAVYAIARHAVLAGDRADPLEVFAANRAAALQAATEYAFEHAYACCSVAASVAVMQGLATDARFEHVFAGACAFLGQTDELLLHLEAALAMSTDPVERVQIRLDRCRFYLSELRYEPCAREVMRAYGELGVRKVTGSWLSLLVTLVAWMWGMIWVRPGGIPLPPGPDRDKLEVLVELDRIGGMVGYYQMNTTVALECVLRSRALARRVEGTEGAIGWIAGAAAVAAIAGRRTLAEALSSEAQTMARGMNDPVAMARAEIFAGFTRQLLGDARAAQDAMRRALDEYGDWLDSSDLLITTGTLAWTLFLHGHDREAIARIDAVRVRDRGGVGRSDLDVFDWFAAPGLAALGQVERGAQVLESYRAIIDKTPTEGWRWAQYLAHRAWFLAETDPHGEGFDEVCAAYDALAVRPDRIALQVRHFYIARVRGWLARVREAPPSDLDAARQQLEAALGQADKAASHPALRCLAWVLRAEALQLSGAWAAADDLLRRAQPLADRDDNVLCHFEITRLRAAALEHGGLVESARREAAYAHAIAVGEGWVPRAAELSARFDVGSPSRTGTDAGTSTSGRSDLRLGQYFEGLLQVSLSLGPGQSVSMRARQALDEVVKILAAERAFLFLDEGDGQLALRAGRSHEGVDLGPSAPYSRTVVSKVRETRRPVLLGVAGQQDGAVDVADSVRAYDLRSIMAAPLSVGDRLLGVMMVDSRLASGVFAAEHVDILQAIANHIAVALEGARAARLEVEIESERTRRELAEGLRAVTAALASTLELSEVLERVLEGLESFLPSDRSAVILRTDDTFELAATRGFGSLPDGGPSALADSGDLRSVVAAGVPRILVGTLPSPHVPPLAPTSGCLAVPLVTRGETVGVLTVERAGSPTLDLRDADLVGGLSGQAAVAIDNARLFGAVRRQATIDPLTGLSNRRQFFSLAGQEVKHTQRYGGTYSVMMLDIDHFKSVNDTWGHTVGDAVLAEVAHRISEQVRSVDVVARFGGEEFIVLLPETGPDGAMLVAGRVGAAIRDTPFSCNSESCVVTVSAGLATAHGDETLDEVIKRSDDALYEAKNSGRDRVVADGQTSG